MAIRTYDEIMDRIRSVIGERSDDDALSLIEDVSDTLTAQTREGVPQEDVERQLRELDESWRQRYRDRFFSGEDTELEQLTESKAEDRDMITIDELFEDKED